MEADVVHSLRILGLPADATSEDVRAAFRRLARTYHPDVAGKYYAYKFEQIAKAYALLKDAPLAKARGKEAKAQRNAGHGFSFSAVLTSPFAWYRKRRAERSAARKAERDEKEQARAADARAAEAVQKKTLLERELRAEAVLKRGERLIAAFENRAEREARDIDARGFALRLGSDRAEVRCMALSRLGAFDSDGVNQPEIFNALSRALQKWDIDENTARLAAALSLTPENRRKLARALAVKAGAMPDSLLSYLLRLHNPSADDLELLEAYLAHAGPGGIALILRRWPGGPFLSEPAFCRLISRDDESVLITTLSAMKRRSVPCPAAGRERLQTHLSHPSAAVRVWAKALLNTA